MKKITYILLGASLTFASCGDLLDRPDLNKIVDSEEKFWRNETDVRLFANEFYSNYFVGYNSGYGTAYAPQTGYTFSDDLTSENKQPTFLGSVPNDGGGSFKSETAVLRNEHPGPNWNFYWVRKSNTMINRLDAFTKDKVSTEAYNHWLAVAKFFRGFEYSRLVSNFGDVPYFDAPIEATDFDTQYKQRDSRVVVMDKVYDDFKYVLENLRVDDGKGFVNRYAAAAMISNMMLFEGSWQHYHKVDKANAQKFLELAIEASEYVMQSGKYQFTSDFKSLFASDDLAENKEVIFSRSYNDVVGVRHSASSYSNGTEKQVNSANLNLLEAFVCNDGNVYANSAVANADNFRLKELVKTRDPRFEATFMDTVNTPAVGTHVYSHKFVARDVLGYIGKTYPAKWTANTNTNDAAVVRLSEVVLNWIEAKQILAEFYGGPAVTQADLDKSINAIRKRPLDAVAEGKGVKQTAALILGALPADNSRDGDVSQLMWEIRRERRMEFVFEYSRIQDIRRWKKLDYLNFKKPNYGMGSWIVGVKDYGDKKNPGKILDAYKGRLKVLNSAGAEVTYDGTNDADMVGFYLVPGFVTSTVVENRNYLAPVSTPLMQEYKARGYNLSQTVGW